ncbi:MAG: flagellar cap protein FliD N-terminal domain-containing protein, partial [Acetanaerobacterium sp.]
MFSSVAGLGTNSSATKKSYGSGIGGLVSGIDTDELIKSLTITAQARVDAANQKKQKIMWQQDAYREVINSVTSFKSSYFDVASATTNLSSTSAFNTWKTTSSSGAVTATTTSANTGEMIMIQSVDEVATAHLVKSGLSVSGAILSTGSLADLNSMEMTFTLDGVSKTINLGDDPQAALV